MPRRTCPDPLAQTIGQRLRALRQERGLTAEKVELFDLLVQPQGGLRATLVDRTRALDPAQLEKLLHQIVPPGTPREASGSRPSLGAVRAYPSLEVAAGWSRPAQAPSRVSSNFVRLPGEFDRSLDFAVRASGTSMQGPKPRMFWRKVASR